MAFDKRKANIYLDKKLKKRVKLSIEIEPILPGDSDYELLQKARKHFKERPEDYVTLDEVNWN